MTDQAVTDVASPFSPDWVSPPGDTILDLLEEREWTQAQLADRLGYSTKHVNQLVKGKVPLSEDAAVRLQNVLGVTVGFWLKREALYRERMALLEAAESYATMVPWLERFPIKDLMEAGALPKGRVDSRSKPGLVEELLAFFGVATPDQWQSQYGCMELAFRRSRAEQCDVGAISAWLRMGERVAEKADGPRYDEGRFLVALQELRKLTTQAPDKFEPRLRRELHESGVALVLLPAIPRTHVSGVARWLNPHRPLIQMSLYGKSNDRFWFTLFHEAAHILLHGKEKKSVFLDDPGKAGSDSKEEREANVWAGDFLIPSTHSDALIGLKTKSAVHEFAARIGVHPGIVVGRLQHDKLINPSWMNDLKERFEFRSAG